MDIRNRLYISGFSERAAELAKEYNVGIEINHTCISDSLDDRAKLVSDIRKDLDGIDKLIMHGPFTEIHPASIDSRIRDAGMLRLKEAVEVLKELGLSRMVVHTGWLPFIYFKEYQAEKAAQFFERLMDSENFTLAVENVLEDEPYMIKDMMEKINNPNIGICLDVGHANCMDKERDIYTWIDVLSPYIVHIHLHNNDRLNDRHWSFDKGTMDISAVIAYIEKNCRPDITYTIESHDAESSLIYLKKEGFI
ncbi:MAG: sugar phosphate isomerase/epimerase [Clostridia bacterium]|nr:sugar phosphate isomerase/epimerase [Clostridia bacterium]